MTEPTAPVLINYTEALRRLQTVSAGREDYNNAPRAYDGSLPACRNLARDAEGNIVGSCIVGSAFRDELVEAGITPEHSVNNGGVYAMLAEALNGKVTATDAAYRLLEKVQEYQDQGVVWGAAITKAKEYIADSDFADADDTVACDPRRVSWLS